MLERLPVAVRRKEIQKGDRGTWETLAAMEAIAREGALHPQIRATTFQVLRSAGVPSGDRPGEVGALYRFVRDSVDYRRDPVGAELVAHPVVTLTMGAGDCDDRSILLASMLRSVGHPTRFLVSSTGSEPNPPFRHVFLAADIAGSWTALDPTKGLQPGMIYKGTTRIARPVHGGRFRNLVPIHAGGYRVVRLSIPRRALENPDLLAMGITDGDPTLELFGFIKKAAKKVVKTVKKVKPLKLVGKVAKAVSPVASLIPGAGIALKGISIASALKKSAKSVTTTTAKPAPITSAVLKSIAATVKSQKTPGASPAAAATLLREIQASASPALYDPSDAAAAVPATIQAPEGAGVAPSAVSTLIPGVPNRTLLIGAAVVLGLALLASARKGAR